MEHSKEFEKLVADILPNVREISVTETRERIKNGAILIDVREDHEWNEKHAVGAVHIGRGVIEHGIVHLFPDKNAELILYCGGGYRSALATDNLQKNGLRQRFLDARRLDGVGRSGVNYEFQITNYEFKTSP